MVLYEDFRRSHHEFTSFIMRKAIWTVWREEGREREGLRYRKTHTQRETDSGTCPKTVIMVCLNMLKKRIIDSFYYILYFNILPTE